MHFKSILLVAAAILLTACGQQQAIHDTTEKSNIHISDLSSAKAAETGSAETLSGKYKIEGTENTFYVDMYFTLTVQLKWLLRMTPLSRRTQSLSAV